jgi:hypothetical protein
MKSHLFATSSQALLHHLRMLCPLDARLFRRAVQFRMQRMAAPFDSIRPKLMQIARGTSV